MVIKGKVWKFGDDINTDLIFPHSAFRVPAEEQIKYVFSGNRPGWADEVKPTDIIVSGRNFGTGSSRPGAALFKRLQLGALVSESINGLFFRNCISYGLPALQCEGVAEAFEEGDEAEVNLEEGTVENCRTGKVLQGMKLSGLMIDIIKQGGIEQLLRKNGSIE